MNTQEDEKRLKELYFEKRGTTEATAEQLHNDENYVSQKYASSRHRAACSFSWPWSRTMTAPLAPCSAAHYGHARSRGRRQLLVAVVLFSGRRRIRGRDVTRSFQTIIPIELRTRNRRTSDSPFD